MNDYSMSTAALYDGGWRSTDSRELMAEYGLTQEETYEICNRLQEIEHDHQ